jgi:hypothetical protein
VDIGFAWPAVGVQEVDRVVASIAGPISGKLIKNEPTRYSKQTTIRGAVVEQSGRSPGKPSAEDEALESPS